MSVLLCLVALFAPGETLRYDVRYGPVKFGGLELITLGPDTVRAETCHHFRAVLETNPDLAALFQGRYIIETWCRVNDMVTLRSYKKTAEKRYQAEWHADYDYAEGRVRYSDGKEYHLRGPSRDLLTLWHYFRTLSLEPGDTVEVYAHTDRREYDVRVGVTRRASVRTAAGRFDCLELLPTARGPLGTVYLADRSEPIPVVIRTRLGSFLVSAYLREFVPREDE